MSNAFLSCSLLAVESVLGSQMEKEGHPTHLNTMETLHMCCVKISLPRIMLLQKAVDIALLDVSEGQAQTELYKHWRGIEMTLLSHCFQNAKLWQTSFCKTPGSSFGLDICKDLVTYSSVTASLLTLPLLLH